ncbi:DNA_polymerase kappa-related protein [Hexamita inflata]|uniref:DNA polymerase kappa n=1 Tax=Hexamita inflata TaxID=28002 RepID=A0AA86V3W2_9EUKA|nr:DNA polymerase kappa-related protein [Hexamita inflata]
MNRLNLLDTTKNGLQTLDIQEINRKITDQTYGSAKYDMIQQRTEKTIQKSVDLQVRTAELNQRQIQAKQLEIDSDLFNRYEQLFRNQKIICVVDFDCFFCAVESISNPALNSKPMIVAGGSIVCASNYEARKYGIRSAMPTKVCLELCPHLTVIQTNSSKYAEVSQRAGQVFKLYDRNFTMLSVDEAELDLTYVVRQRLQQGVQLTYVESDYQSTNFLTPPSNIELITAQIALELRTQLNKLLKITASCGISVSTQLAKLCADLRKPNGQSITKLQFTSPTDLGSSIRQILAPLPVRKIWGIGGATHLLLKNAFKIDTIGQIYEKRATIMLTMTKSAIDLVLASCGLQTILEGFSQEDAKSIGNEVTFKETGDMEQLKSHLMGISKKVACRLIDANKHCTRIRVKVRFADWSDYSHVESVSETQNLDDIFQTGVKIMKQLIAKKSLLSGGKIVQTGFGNSKNDCSAAMVRLIGISSLEFAEENGRENGILEQLRKIKNDKELKMEEESLEKNKDLKNEKCENKNMKTKEGGLQNYVQLNMNQNGLKNGIQDLKRDSVNNDRNKVENKSSKQNVQELQDSSDSFEVLPKASLKTKQKSGPIDQFLSKNRK